MRGKTRISGAVRGWLLERDAFTGDAPIEKRIKHAIDTAEISRHGRGVSWTLLALDDDKEARIELAEALKAYADLFFDGIYRAAEEGIGGSELDRVATGILAQEALKA